MPSLTDLPELVGFFSYSRRDDERAGGSLSALRKLIHNELGMQLGRDDLRVWQDTVAIPHGTLWRNEIDRAIAESVFFIPIVTPSAVRSPHCTFEFKAFLERESALYRSDLVFPILYVRVPELENQAQRDNNEALTIIHARQYLDWTKNRHEETSSNFVRKQAEDFCGNIVAALSKYWESPEERRRKAEAQARLTPHEDRPKQIQSRNVEVRVPTLYDSVSEITVGKWLKRPGDLVNNDEPLVELETEKATIELNSSDTGVLSTIIAETGATVLVGALLGFLSVKIAAAKADSTK